MNRLKLATMRASYAKVNKIINLDNGNLYKGLDLTS
jgi:hypothetical protein